MSRWVICHLCGCTGVHRDRSSNQIYPCPNGCAGGRVYEETNREWFDRLAAGGARIHTGPAPTRSAEPAQVSARQAGA